jgi:hypothetical protein
MAPHHKESGNILFLILIAVALFAALSFAITQSSRSTGSTKDEQTVVSDSVITQYPPIVRTGILRMITANSTDPMDVKFNSPSTFASLTNTTQGVFHPNGGSTTYETGDPQAMQSGVTGPWHFNVEFEIQNIGTSVPDSSDGNELTAFLPGVSQNVCTQIDTDLGIGAIPNTTVDLSASYDKDMDTSYILPTGETVLGSNGGNGTDALNSQSSGCFRNNGGEYVYYQVLLER